MAKILLIENNMDILYANKVMLELEGYEVISAKDFYEGKKSATECAPWLIVPDISEPESDWQGFCEDLLKDGNFKFLFLCAMETKEETLNVMRKKGFDFVLKPYLMENLIEKINLKFRETEVSHE